MSPMKHSRDPYKVRQGNRQGQKKHDQWKQSRREAKRREREW